MTEPRPDEAELRRFSLAFLTDQWEWEADLAAATVEHAMEASRQALEDLVREEKPELACVTVFEAGVKIGVWDWIEKRPYWTSA